MFGLRDVRLNFFFFFWGGAKCLSHYDTILWGILGMILQGKCNGESHAIELSIWFYICLWKFYRILIVQFFKSLTGQVFKCQVRLDIQPTVTVESKSSKGVDQLHGPKKPNSCTEINQGLHLPYVATKLSSRVSWVKTHSSFKRGKRAPRTQWVNIRSWPLQDAVLGPGCPVCSLVSECEIRKYVDSKISLFGFL